MKFSSINTGYDFMRYCRMRPCFQRPIREMNIGDTFFLGKLCHPATEQDKVGFVAEAWIEKERGKHTFYATWTFPTKPSRAFIMTQDAFTLGRGGIIAFKSPPETVKHFARVCRYLAWYLEHLPHDERKRWFAAHSIPLLNGVWLDKDLIEKKDRARMREGKIERFRVSYANMGPTHPLAALVHAGMALGCLPNECNHEDDCATP